MIYKEPTVYKTGLSMEDVINKLGYVDVTNDFDTSFAPNNLSILELSILYSEYLRLIYISLRAEFDTPQNIVQVTPNILIAQNTNTNSILHNKEFSRVAYGKHTEDATQIEISGDTVRIFDNKLIFTPAKTLANPDRATVLNLFARVIGFELS